MLTVIIFASFSWFWPVMTALASSCEIPFITLWVWSEYYVGVFSVQCSKSSVDSSPLFREDNYGAIFFNVYVRHCTKCGVSSDYNTYLFHMHPMWGGGGLIEVGFNPNQIRMCVCTNAYFTVCRNGICFIKNFLWKLQRVFLTTSDNNTTIAVACNSSGWPCFLWWDTCNSSGWPCFLGGDTCNSSGWPCFLGGDTCNSSGWPCFL